MRSPNAKNNLALFGLALLFLLSFSLRGQSTHRLHKEYIFIGTWQYLSASRNDTALFTVGANDSMVIQNNGHFFYDIQAPNKHARGTWKLAIRQLGSGTTVGVLQFSYEPDHKQRDFMICASSSDSLTLCEGNNTFRYKRK